MILNAIIFNVFKNLILVFLIQFGHVRLIFLLFIYKDVIKLMSSIIMIWHVEYQRLHQLNLHNCMERGLMCVVVVVLVIIFFKPWYARLSLFACGCFA
jgi:hypothetical protein